MPVSELGNTRMWARMHRYVSNPRSMLGLVSVSILWPNATSFVPVLITLHWCFSFAGKQMGWLQCCRRTVGTFSLSSFYSTGEEVGFDFGFGPLATSVLLFMLSNNLPRSIRLVGLHVILSEGQEEQLTSVCSRCLKTLEHFFLLGWQEYESK